ncbi:MAG: hypothetical protein KGH84_00300 [Paracoccaceae bacterium]|nr:hypothetical protein [Paracoccaceae bacterium]
MKTFRDGGAIAMRHKARGRPSNNRTLEGLRNLTLAIVRERYADFGPTLAAEKLAERDGVEISRETLRKWMVEDGLWLSRSQRRVFHRPRLRRECYGELIQIDGSDRLTGAYQWAAECPPSFAHPPWRRGWRPPQW